MVLIAASSPGTGDLFFGCALQHRVNGLAAEAREISVSGGWANVAAPGQTGGSEYKAYTFALRARLGF